MEMKQYNSQEKLFRTYIFIELKRSGTFGVVESSTSCPGGNQVGGLPPASSLENFHFFFEPENQF